MRRALSAAAPRLRPSCARALASSAAAPSPRVAVVQGASRGLGLELARQLAARPDTAVVATCRNPDGATGLQKLAAEAGGRVTVLRLDLTDDASIDAAAAAVGDAHGRADLVLNASGILHGGDVGMPETALARVSRAALTAAYEINAAGPILVAKAFEPLLRSAGKDRAAAEAPPAVLASISARVGSISDNGLGGWHSYRASKAALNMLTVNAALEFARKKAGVAAIVLHPGTCETDLSAPFRRGVPPGKLFSVERGASQLLSIIDGVTLDDNGSFFAWDGQRVPW
jgi:NAD(P)-dependent dehydrogenase (short-subunit alcohol dehydrogenase family)